MRDPQELSISHLRITQGPSLAANNCRHLWPQDRCVPASLKEGSEYIFPLADPDTPEFTLFLMPEHCRNKCPIQQERPSDRDDVGLCVHASRAPFCLDARNGRSNRYQEPTFGPISCECHFILSTPGCQACRAFPCPNRCPVSGHQLSNLLFITQSRCCWLDDNVQSTGSGLSPTKLPHFR